MLITQPVQEKIKQSTLIFGVIRCAALHSCTSALNTIQCEPKALLGWYEAQVTIWSPTIPDSQQSHFRPSRSPEKSVTDYSLRCVTYSRQKASAAPRRKPAILQTSRPLT